MNETLRELLGDDVYARVAFRAHADAWEKSNNTWLKMWQAEHNQATEALTHIEALERDWNDLTKVTERACELTDQECDTIPEEAWPHFDVGTSHLRQGLAALREAEDYPPDSGCTKHLGEPWPCPRCAALQEAEDED